MRVTLCAVLALALNLLLFQFMAGLIARHRLGSRPILHVHRLDFIRLPEAEAAPPPPRRRAVPEPPPPSRPPSPSSQPTAPVRGTVRQLPVPDLALKVEVPLAASVKVAAPALPSLLVEGETSGPPGPVHLPPQPPSFISASELIPVARIPPVYPPEAKRRRIEGYVVVEFTVTETGEVKNPKIIESRPPGVFDRAVLRAVRHWRFRPKKWDGRPVAVRAQQKLEFRLRR
ncbi:periplasmic protein TonB [Methylomarinovum caldicuralii]|uniref:Protein TonB n=1 Tax=Methylomarinovum caldicuralii TaxID=438856 RepID=A0AAU9CMU7_9GAMM|nr:energy transducer TonB [Methylomarinovum caldicuralii]BCX81233.1 periplasmic protein TonB [Methylomarinovum caldicuralii]